MKIILICVAFVFLILAAMNLFNNGMVVEALALVSAAVLFVVYKYNQGIKNEKP